MSSKMILSERANWDLGPPKFNNKQKRINELFPTQQWRAVGIPKVIKRIINKGPLILLCRIISVECPTNSDPRFMLIGCLELPLF